MSRGYTKEDTEWAGAFLRASTFTLTGARGSETKKGRWDSSHGVSDGIIQGYLISIKRGGALPEELLWFFRVGRGFRGRPEPAPELLIGPVQSTSLSQNLSAGGGAMSAGLLPLGACASWDF